MVMEYKRLSSWLTTLNVLLLAELSTSSINPNTTVGCYIRRYSLHISKPWRDEEGMIHRCHGLFEVDSCWGRCESTEVGYFQMPFKKSHHPVCTYAGRRFRMVTLDHCIGHPEPEVQVFDASACICRKCNSEIESCEN